MKVSKDMLIGEFRNTLFADVAFPVLGDGCRLATMNSYYYDFSSYLGAELYVVIEDDASAAGWAVAFFDEINFYYEEEVDFSAMKDVVNESNNVGTTVELPYTLATNVAKVKNVYNGGFENGNLAGWQVVEGNINTEAAVISAETFWGEQISYNQGGSYHFDGWAATGVEGDGYRLRSTNFTLSGSGWISFKMGGNAAKVRVFLADGTMIANYDNTAFADVSFPVLANGCRLATMTRFFADLSAYLGQEVYVELVDDASAAGWAVAFFDDINCYYEEAPETVGADIVKESNATGEDVEIAWIVATNTVTQ